MTSQHKQPATCPTQKADGAAVEAYRRYIIQHISEIDDKDLLKQIYCIILCMSK